MSTIITGTQGMSQQEVLDEVERGGRFVFFQYTVSLLVITMKRPTAIHFLRAHESAFAAGLKWSLVSFVAGWWGVPWGFIYTPWAIISNSAGGTNVTAAVLKEMRAKDARMEAMRKTREQRAAAGT